MSKKTKIVVFSQEAIDQLASYGVSPEIATSAGVGFIHNAQLLSPSYSKAPALVFPYFDLDGELIPPDDFCRVRYLWGEGFEGPRYGQLPKSLNRCYLPPIRAGEEFTWRKVAKDPKKSLLILEGEGKGLCICTVNGVLAIALGGVDMWKALQSKGIAALYPLEEIVWAGRLVTIVYDTDCAEGLKEPVHRAAMGLMDYLLGKGACAYLCVLPPGEDGKKVAADDYVMRHGIENFSKFVDENKLIHDSTSKLIEVSERYAYCRENDCFVDKQAKNRLEPIERDKLNRILGRQKIRYPDLVPGTVSNPLPVTRLMPTYLVDALNSWPGALKFDRLSYSPGLGRVVEKKGEIRCNLWCGWEAEYEKHDGSPVRVKMPSDKIRDAMLGEYWWLLDNVFGEDPEMRAFIEHWLFYPLKFPGAKLHQYILVISKLQGIGKDLIAKILINFIYGPHGKHLRQTDIDKDNRFNYHEYGISLLWGDEVVTSGARRYYEELKSVTTDDSLTIERKGMHPIDFDENHLNRYLTANELSFGSGIERREGLMMPRKSIKDEPRLTSIYNLFREHGGAPLLWYAREKYVEGSYAPFGIAPLSAQKSDARENAGDMLNNWLEELLKTKDLNRPYFSSEEIWTLFKSENTDVPDHQYNISGLPNRMSRIGYRKLFGGNQIYVKIVGSKAGGSGGKVKRVYVWAYVDPTEIDTGRPKVAKDIESEVLERVRPPDPPEEDSNVVEINSRKKRKSK